MRIAICEFGQETNSFSRPYSDFSLLAPYGWMEPETLIETNEGTAQYLGGAIRAAREEGAELVPLPSIRILGGSTLLPEAFNTALTRIIAHLETVKDSIDGIYFALHGAGCTTEDYDIESTTLRALRNVVGDQMPITASLDLHGNLSHNMVKLATGLFGIKENPHVDCAAAGYLAFKILCATVRGEKKPQMALVQLPMLITPATSNTVSGPMKEVNAYFAQYVKDHDLIDATFFHGFSAADHPDSCASVLVVADGYDPTEHAEALARYFWRRRREFLPVSLTPDQAIDQALEKVKDGFVVINEISDNPGSGCPGDGTHLLRALLKRDLPGTIFSYIKDAEVAAQAHAAGVGAKISIHLGGKTDNMHGQPIDVDDVEVVALSDGTYIYTSPVKSGLPCVLGPTARLRHGNVEFIVVTMRVQALDDGAMFITGTGTEHYRIVCLKSANHFRGFFQPRADAIVTADPPGLRCSDLTTYNYRNMRSPLYPLDENTTFMGE